MKNLAHVLRTFFWVWATVWMCIFLFLGYQLTDNSPPRSDTAIVPTKAGYRRGEAMTVDVTSTWLRVCPGTVYRTMVSATNPDYVYASNSPISGDFSTSGGSFPENRGPSQQIHTLPWPRLSRYDILTIPANAPLGAVILYVHSEFACNFVQKWFPLKYDYSPIRFEIIG